MRVIVGCEYSGTVRDAFLRAGHDAISCDILPSETPGPHYQGDIRDIVGDGFDLGIFHPPCTYLTNAANGSLDRLTPSPSGALTGPARWRALIEGAVFLRTLLNAPIPRVAIENPVMNGHAQLVVGSRPTQTIQPWMFGHMESKAICLWLKGLPPLVTTEDVRAAMLQRPKSEWARVHHMSPGADRAKERARFYPSIADAMAAQWGALDEEAAA